MGKIEEREEKVFETFFLQKKKQKTKSKNIEGKEEEKREGKQDEEEEGKGEEG